MQIKRWLWLGVLGLALLAMAAPAAAADPLERPFPSFGSGTLEVRLYTDYFCSPCRALEPTVEPILKDMVQKRQIRLTLVDVPMHPHSIMYARHFLFALKAKWDLEQAFKVRNVLIEASRNKDNSTPERLEGIFKGKGIPYEFLDPRPLFSRYDSLLKEDEVDATPTCVIVRGTEKKKAVGSEDVLKALKALP